MITEIVTSCPPDLQARGSTPQEMKSVSHKYLYFIEADAKYAPETNAKTALLNIAPPRPNVSDVQHVG